MDDYMQKLVLELDADCSALEALDQEWKDAQEEFERATAELQARRKLASEQEGNMNERTRKYYWWAITWVGVGIGVAAYDGLPSAALPYISRLLGTGLVVLVLMTVMAALTIEKHL